MRLFGSEKLMDVFNALGVPEGDIRTAPGHIGRNGNGSVLACMAYDFCFLFMELRIHL